MAKLVVEINCSYNFVAYAYRADTVINTGAAMPCHGEKSSPASGNWDRLKTVCGRWGRSKRGNATIIFGMIAPAIIGITGLSVDAVSWYLTKRELQVIADTAAITTAHVLNYENDHSKAQTAGEAEVANRLGERLASASVSVNSPPTTGAYAGDTSAASVGLLFSHPLYFAGVVLSSNTEIRAHAVAKRVNTGTQCILALDPTASRAVEFSGSASMVLGCGIMSNSDDADSMYVSGSTYLDVTQLTAAGDIYFDGSATLVADRPSQPLSPAATDPYGPEGRNLQVPSSLGPCVANHLVVTSTATLNPGRYCNGLQVTSGNVTLSPGTYYIDGGTFKATGGSTISGDGVTLVLTGGGGNYATMDIEGGTMLDLSAPTEGSGADYEGVLIYQDQNAPSEQGAVLVKNKIVGGADLELSGAIYIPKQLLEMSGGASGNTECLQIIAKQVKFASDTRILNNCPANSGIAAILQFTIKLVE